MPELVTTVVAVRRGALQLAVGGIIGGTMLDTLFLAASDVSYRDGSLFHAVSDQDYFWMVSALLMTGILIGGLIRRQRQESGKIGAEIPLLLLTCGGAVVTQFLV